MKKIILGCVLLFTSLIFIGIELQLSEIARYLCILSGQEFTWKWYEFLNPVSIICSIGTVLISVIILIIGLEEIRNVGK